MRRPIRKGWLLLAVPLGAVALYATQVQAQLPSEGITGYERVFASSDNSDDKNKTATASCPEGKVATGGGYAVSGKNPGSVAIFGNAPNSDVSWRVNAKRSIDISKSWVLTAVVICADGTPSASASPSASPSGSPSASPTGSPASQ
jgi:hypothetical protein